jgi:hypothetical protein
LDVYAYRWPSGAEKVELVDGALLFSGEFDERDVEIAERTYPGRRVLLGPHGVLCRLPGRLRLDDLEPVRRRRSLVRQPPLAV